MSALVKSGQLVAIQGKQVMTDSRVIARVFGMAHNKVIDSVRVSVDEFPSLNGKSERNRVPSKSAPVLCFEEKIIRGKAVAVAVMNEHAFSLVMLRFTTPRARKMQDEFVQQFHDMRLHLQAVALNKTDPAWLTARTDGKLTRREETDVIQQFVGYARAQGSQNAERYYTSLTKLVYRSLGLPAGRAGLSRRDIARLTVAESLVSDELQAAMDCGDEYHDAFRNAKAAVRRLGDALGGRQQ